MRKRDYRRNGEEPEKRRCRLPLPLGALVRSTPNRGSDGFREYRIVRDRVQESVPQPSSLPDRSKIQRA